MKTFLFLLRLPTETVHAIEDMPNEALRRTKVHRLIHSNRAAILRMIETSVLDQIQNPREFASLTQAPGGGEAQVVTRLKKSVRDLPETEPRGGPE